jgi:hypothetical protein
MMERRRKRCKQILGVLKETRGYWKLNKEAVDHTVYRTPFGRGYGPVVRQTTQLINETNTDTDELRYVER